ncbi:hypothetical protein [Aquimarina macrocephali]
MTLKEMISELETLKIIVILAFVAMVFLYLCILSGALLYHYLT